MSQYVACRKRERERENLRAERQAMRTAEERKLSHTLPTPDPYTQFEPLQAPTLDSDISTAKLFDMTKHVPSRQVSSHTHTHTHVHTLTCTHTHTHTHTHTLQMIPQQYTAHSEGWRSLEPLPPLHPLIRPKPPATKFSGTFDEVITQ